MIPMLLLSAGLCAAAPAAPLATDLAAYDTARDTVGRTPEAQIKLALWCEAHGLSAERVKHLALAVLTEPDNARARGLLGLIDFRGRWQRPEAVSAKVKADEALTAKLADYNGRRGRAAETADAQWKLALWCEEVGLDAEARAHLATTVRLDPGREAAWKRLGFENQNGRWVTDAQLATEKLEADTQKRANQYWKPLLGKWRTWLSDKARKSEAENALAKVDDPRAVPAVCLVFGGGDAARQAIAVQLLGQIDAPAASRALAMLAIYARTQETRRAATETLKRRDAREVLDDLVGLLRTPIKFEVRPFRGPRMPGELFVEGERYNVHRVYGVSPNLALRVPQRIFDNSVPFAPDSDQTRWLASNTAGTILAETARGYDGSRVSDRAVDTTSMAADRDVRIAQALNRLQPLLDVSQQQLDNDVSRLENINRDIREVNARTLPVLTSITAEDLGEAPAAWQAWLADQKGYSLKTQERPFKPTISTFVENPLSRFMTGNSCFGAGTAVRTLEGTRPIELVRTGDQVLSQDAATGRLRFVPVLAVFHNKPAPTLRVEFTHESVVATGIHRFWKAGHGWVMARDLKPGDVVRTLGGTAVVLALKSDSVRPVFNLEVAEGQSFFVGETGALVHDNSLVQPATEPFDAPVELTALAKASQ
ncbi:polymorphic toxin-type HINT domain-containing protein [Singulisphaera sp. Ch08]|uniref:Polymorphic toxin-type HINT domain-containing protein n=1 Tax=Singulisphaera sp. Ch08 TaxID=3120278 RepID=A0AAU7CIJ8_9BACT